eukprot:TRINITY_DN41480_c0_g1_i1.p1 TRINITY_DN41480_c0_g1~~TRINITY_DN41480_c0_g1_i1.p1  ORF type:complete len:117 (-),score=26.69 TRINITY_DN41480_c0_g1_i1:24-374(-)
MCIRDRYEFYRRSALSHDKITKELRKLLGYRDVDHKVSVAVAGVTKLFVAELMETAFVVMDQLGEGTSATKPKHIREAFRRLRPGWKHGISKGSVRAKNRILRSSRKLTCTPKLKD